MFMFSNYSFITLLYFGQTESKCPNFGECMSYASHFQFSSGFICDHKVIVGVLAMKHAISDMKIKMSVQSNIQVFAVISEAFLFFRCQDAVGGKMFL